MAIASTWPVVSRGIGRSDYSAAIDFASQATMRGHQARFVVAWTFEDVPTSPFPYAYEYVIGFYDFHSETWVYAAPAQPYHIFRVALTTDRNALVDVVLAKYASIADYLAGIIDTVYGEVFGYQNTELLVTNGVRTEEGCVYSVIFAEWSEEAYFTAHIMENKIAEEVIYG